MYIAQIYNAIKDAIIFLAVTNTTTYIHNYTTTGYEMFLASLKYIMPLLLSSSHHNLKLPCLF